MTPVARRRALAWLLPLVAALAAAGAGVSIARGTPDRPLVEPRAAPPTPPAALVADQPGGVIGAVGLVEAASEEVAIGSHRAGVVARVAVRPGDRVRAGDPLFALDGREARADLARAEAELARAEAEVGAAEAKLADVEDQLRRSERLTVGTSISEDTLARRRFAVRTAAAEAAVARRAVGSGAAARDAAAVGLELLTVRAPLDATVLRVRLRAGEAVEAGRGDDPVMVLGRLDPLHVRAELDETDIPRFAEGARAVASVRGDAARRAPLRLVRVDPLVGPKRTLTGSTTERVDTRVLEVVYALDPSALRAFPGQQVDLFIEAVPTPPPAAAPASPAGRDGPPVAALAR